MCEHCISRRTFNAVTTAGLTAGLWGLGRSSTYASDVAGLDPWDPDRRPIVAGRPLRVQPILAHAVFEPREKTSWRSWSEIVNERAAGEEFARITHELNQLSARAEFPLDILPPVKVTTVDQAAHVHQIPYDVALLFAASNAQLFLPCCAPQPRRDTVVFVRHRSGPLYYGYQCLGTRFFQIPTPELWKNNSADDHGPVTLDDVVVDDYDEVLWRLRALYGLKNFVGQRVLALGGAGGKYAADAPDVARRRYQLDIVDLDYQELADRLPAIWADPHLRQRCVSWTDRYLTLPHTHLETDRGFVERAFALYQVFRQWLVEHEAPAITINACMGTIIGLSDTTACMPLSWLNDEGFMAYCESDFVVVPIGILLHFVTGKPVFMHNSTFPHQATVTCAHCTAPRRMDGTRYEPARIMTHYESDFGAAPKVEMPIGQSVCAVSPEYATGRWLGIQGIVRDNPDFAICRSQQDIEIQGDWRRLIRETRDSHWMMVYGDYLREVGYAARKIGLTWENVSGSA